MREPQTMFEGSGTRESPSHHLAVETLARAARAVHAALPLQEKLTWVADAVRYLTDSAAGVYVGVGESEGQIGAAGAVTYDVEVLARPAVIRLVRPPLTTRPLRAHDLRRDRRWRLFLERVGLPAGADCLGVPVLTEDGGLHGVVIACHPTADHYTIEDETVVAALATHLGVALDNQVALTRLVELHEVQREVVHQLQEAVRPPMPTVEAAELGIHYLPADSSAPTGGDLHDWLILPDGDLHVALVDVMGKGVAATKEAVAVTHALRLLVLDGCPIEGLVERADTLLTAHSPELVATVVVARYRPSDGSLWLAGGGQPPPLIVTEQGDVREVATPGIPLGWPGAGSGEVVELCLERNDTLVLYTDGLIESTKDVLVGLENLTRAASQIALYPSAHVARALVERSLSGAMRRDDSLALVVRRRTPPPPVRTGALGPFEYRFSPSSATVPIGRHLLADWLEHLAVDRSEVGDLLLVASELCSNAVRHASGAPGALVLRVWAEGSDIAIEVQDDGAGFEPRQRYDDELPDPEAERGRGLYVVEALTDEVTVTCEEGKTVVRAIRRAVLPGP
ncbi:MAG: SpoIIE family protein phosphatase [Actinobacteria bacterium]|nr:SpoIIE family protein phosphatase [Actinomycetota bacterium]